MLPEKWPKQFLLKKLHFSKEPKMYPNIWATFVKKLVNKNFQKLHNLVIQ